MSDKRKRTAPQAKEPCAACKKRMAKAPQGYVAWHEWAERMAQRYDCEQCRNCGRWTIWRQR